MTPPQSFTEPQHAGEHLLSEASHTRAREQIVILAGSGADRVLTAGMVLAHLVASATVAVAADAGNTGDGTFAATPVASAGVKAGAYQLVVIEPAANAGQFQLEDPDGAVIGTGTIASAFSGGGLAFTLQDGAADFVAGDRITITVSAPADKWVQHDPDGAAGHTEAAGVLFQDVTALDAVDNANGVAHVRDCEVKGVHLVWQSDITAAEKTTAIAELAARGIIVR